jgi:hypothetical protein
MELPTSVGYGDVHFFMSFVMEVLELHQGNANISIHIDGIQQTYICNSALQSEGYRCFHATST